MRHACLSSAGVGVGWAWITSKRRTVLHRVPLRDVDWCSNTWPGIDWSRVLAFCLHMSSGSVCGALVCVLHVLNLFV